MFFQKPSTLIPPAVWIFQLSFVLGINVKMKQETDTRSILLGRDLLQIDASNPYAMSLVVCIGFLVIFKFFYVKYEKSNYKREFLESYNKNLKRSECIFLAMLVVNNPRVQSMEDLRKIKDFEHLFPILGAHVVGFYNGKLPDDLTDVDGVYVINYGNNLSFSVMKQILHCIDAKIHMCFLNPIVLSNQDHDKIVRKLSDNHDLLMEAGASSYHPLHQRIKARVVKYRGIKHIDALIQPSSMLKLVRSQKNASYEALSVYNVLFYVIMICRSLVGDCKLDYHILDVNKANSSTFFECNLKFNRTISLHILIDLNSSWYDISNKLTIACNNGYILVNNFLFPHRGHSIKVTEANFSYNETAYGNQSSNQAYQLSKFLQRINATRKTQSDPSFEYAAVAATSTTENKGEEVFHCDLSSSHTLINQLTKDLL